MQNRTAYVVKLKQALRVRRTSKNMFVRYAVVVMTAAHRTGRFLLSGEHRSVVLLKLFDRERVHQTTPRTWMNRYPEIFSTCRTYFAGHTNLKILSYGCSTGEEVITLRKYFPSAIITGAEINRRSLAMCRNHKIDDRIAFIHSEHTKIAQCGPFDAIFCMAVLQRTPHTIIDQGITNLKHIYPFEKFDHQVAEFDALLKKGGLLIIRHTQYRFSDASVASKYVALETGRHDVDDGPKFGKNCERLHEGAAANLGPIFVKMTV
jgi:hypothetical protein